MPQTVSRPGGQGVWDDIGFQKAADRLEMKASRRLAVSVGKLEIVIQLRFHGQPVVGMAEPLLVQETEAIPKLDTPELDRRASDANKPV